MPKKGKKRKKRKKTASVGGDQVFRLPDDEADFNEAIYWLTQDRRLRTIPRRGT